MSEALQADAPPQSPYYKVLHSLKSLEDLKKVFPDGKADEYNWCFLSTSGVHGLCTTLDDIEEFPEDITVLVVHPRLVCLRYGNIQIISKDDVEWLRGLVRSTIDAVGESQMGNVWKK